MPPSATRLRGAWWHRVPIKFPAEFRGRSVALVAAGILVLAIAAFALAHCAARASQPVAADRDSSPTATHGLSPPETLRVMSFNIRYGTAPDGEDAWERRRQLVVATIRDFDPDLLGLQECLAEQAEFLQRSLPEHGFVGAGREDGDRGGEMCAVFYRAGRFAKLEDGHFWLSETPDVVASRSWDSALPRMVTWLRLQLRRSPGEASGADTLCLFNTHFDHVGVSARRKSAELLRDRIAAIRGDQPVIVTGDFNAPADPEQEGPYRVLVGTSVRRTGDEPWSPVQPSRASAEAHLMDPYRLLHTAAPGEGTYHGFRGETAGARIDWILISADLAPVTAEIVRGSAMGRYPSDHFPVTAVLHWSLETSGGH